MSPRVVDSVYSTLQCLEAGEICNVNPDGFGVSWDSVVEWACRRV
jgi:hypothetical protein